MGAKRYYNTTNNIQLIYKINMKQSDQMHQAYFFGKIPPFKRGVGWVSDGLINNLQTVNS